MSGLATSASAPTATGGVSATGGVTATGGVAATGPAAYTRHGNTRRPLVIGCGALGRELVELTHWSGLPAMDLACLPAALHNRPERIPGAVAARIRRARVDGYDRIFVAYADCGTGGRLDAVLEAEGVARLPGAHCYEVYAGRAAFAALADAEPGTFYLTDYLVRSFDALVIRGLGLDRHPELLPLYFGNYRRLVYLAQADDPSLTAGAEAAAARLGLDFERRSTGLGGLGRSVAAFGARPVAHDSPWATWPDVAGRARGQLSSDRLDDSHARSRPERLGAARRRRFGLDSMPVRQRSGRSDPERAGERVAGRQVLPQQHVRSARRRRPVESRA